MSARSGYTAPLGAILLAVVSLSLGAGLAGLPLVVLWITWPLVAWLIAALGIATGLVALAEGLAAVLRRGGE